MYHRFFRPVKTSIAIAMLLTATACYGAIDIATMPRRGGGLTDNNDFPMVHIMVSQSGTTLSAMTGTHLTPTLRALPNGYMFMGDASVLNNQAYNFQYGWSAMAGIDVPAGGHVSIKLLDKSPALNAFAGGAYGGMMGGDYAPIWTNIGDTWDWSGAMSHNTYGVLNPTQNNYFATYEVYFADVNDNAIPGYTSANITLNFVPEPMTLSMFAFGVALLKRRRSAIMA